MEHVAGAPEGHTADAAEQTPETPGFGERGRMRRRARFLRKARELAYRDLGGLVFDLHRFGERNDPVVMAKLGTLRQIDTELRALEQALRDRRPVTVLREVGIGACPRCAAIHGSDDRFCPGCGLAFDTNADRPIATAPVMRPAQTASAPISAASAAGTQAAPAQRSGVQTPSTQATPAQSSAQIAPGARPSPAPAPTAARPVQAPGATLAAGATPAPGATPASGAAPSPGFAGRMSRPTPSGPTPSAPPAQTDAQSPTSPASPDRPEREPADEDEPTQILRPPASGA